MWGEREKGGREKTNYYHSDKTMKVMALLKSIVLHSFLTRDNFAFKVEILNHFFVALKYFLTIIT